MLQSYKAFPHERDFFKMLVKNQRFTKSSLHVCDVIFACPLIIHDVTIFPNFIPQNTVEGCSCLEHAPVVLLTKLTANGTRELAEFIVVRSQF